MYWHMTVIYITLIIFFAPLLITSILELIEYLKYTIYKENPRRFVHYGFAIMLVLGFIEFIIIAIFFPDILRF